MSTPAHAAWFEQQMRSNLAAVCEALARDVRWDSADGFLIVPPVDPLVRRVLRHAAQAVGELDARKRLAVDVEHLLAGLEVGSVSELRHLVAEGHRSRPREVAS